MKTSHWHIRHSLLLFVLIAGWVISFAQTLSPAPNYIITKRWLSVEDGLPSRLVNAAVQDNAGFMWFATANGLSRYDGNSFQTYNGKNSGLFSNSIKALAIDNDNHLLIYCEGTTNQNNKLEPTQVLDLSDYKFKRLTDVFPDIPFPVSRIRTVSSDGSGNLFFLLTGPNQVWQHHKKNGFRLRCGITKLSEKFDIFNPEVNKITSAYGCAALKIWGAAQMNFIFPDTAFALIMENENKKIVGINSRKEIILYNEGSNVYSVINRAGKETGLKFSNTAISKATQSGSFFNVLHPILGVDEHNQLYMLQNEALIVIRDSNEIKKDGSITVLDKFRDKPGNLWICTEKGVFLVAVHQNKFQHYFSNLNSNQLNNSSTRGIYLDREKETELNPQKKLYALVNGYFLTPNYAEKGYKTQENYSMLRMKDVIYVTGQDLSRYTISTEKIVNINPPFKYGWFFSIAGVSDRAILLGGSSGLFLLNPVSNKVEALKYLKKSIPPPVYVYRLVKTRKKGWVAVAENGIYFINDQFAVYRYLGSQNKSQDQLPFSGTIYDFHEDREGVAWVALNGDGLIRWNWNAGNPMAAENVKQFTVDNGLPDNILYRIEEDNNNNLWMSTYNGLVRFNKASFITKIYKTKDGLANTEFNRLSSFKDANGWLYFGGMNGIDAFNPAEMMEDTAEAAVAFQWVTLSKFSAGQDKIVDVSEAFRQQKEIVMNVGDKFLSASFSLLDFQDRPHRFAYRMDGLVKDWSYISENIIRISGLPYGKFILHIKAQLESGKWNTEDIEIPITVLKPVYLKAWFIVTVLSGLILIFILYYQKRIRKIKMDTQRLELLVQNRTNSLSKALSDREILLKEIHHRVKNNLQIISGLLQLQKDGLHDEQAKALLSEGQSRVGSIALIHQNLYQFEELGNIEFKSFLIDLSKLIDDLFERKHRKLIVHYNFEKTLIDIDTAVPLGLIVNELLTNSYKYAFVNQQNATVDINLRQLDEGVYQLVYHDNGPGIKEILDFDNAKTLGMNLIGGLAKQLSGTADYFFDDGSTFIINFKDSMLRKNES